MHDRINRYKIIYYISNNYPEERCVINKCAGFDYVSIEQEKTVKKILDKILQSIRNRYSNIKGEKTLSAYAYAHRDGVIHTFNCCIKSRTPWICTFESVVPRTNCTRKRDWNEIDRLTCKTTKLLAKENCLQCLALSEAAYRLQMDFLLKLKGRLSNKEIEIIKSKILVLHPPQEVLTTENDIVKKFSMTNKKEFIFVGHDFFRKGGKEVVDTLRKLESKYDFHLTIVSKMEYDDYASKATKEERDEYLAFFEDCDWITYYEEMDNEQVIRLCKDMHIGLLPTFADTYGYSVLEMQASGCTMITTDVRALPEINNSRCGYICHLPHDEFGEAYYHSVKQRKEMKQNLMRELEVTFKEVLGAPMSELCEKAINSVRRIEKMHDPKIYGECIKNILNEKLAFQSCWGEWIKNDTGSTSS